ncbi:ThiF family adenylyltransferase [Candidatus Woesebacteria bacterium]|nr:ThiF family adenylyltransferase [Candidatus Woesebacteria bacterium]
MDPLILQEGKYDKSDIVNLKARFNVWNILDLFERQLQELSEVVYPQENSSNKKARSAFIAEKMNSKPNLKGNWVYFPWNGNLIHTVIESDYQKLRTNRNQLLITNEEQAKIYNAVAGVIGLSIGSHIAINLTQGGFSKSMKLADHDFIDTTNLNRLRAGISDVYKSKIDSVSEKIFEINPYSDLIRFKGLNDDTLDDFINNDPVPSIIFEVIDDFRMKIKLRQAAKKKRIPVVMFSNVGDTIIIDVERYDLDKDLTIFNGLLADLPEKILKNPDADAHNYAVQMVGKQYVSQRALDSVKSIGVSLRGRPQLVSSIVSSSGIAGYIMKQIITGDERVQGRSVLKFNDIFSKG